MEKDKNYKKKNIIRSLSVSSKNSSEKISMQQFFRESNSNATITTSNTIVTTRKGRCEKKGGPQNDTWL